MPIGSKLDDFLKEVGILETTRAAAIMKVQLQQKVEESSTQLSTNDESLATIQSPKPSA